MNPVSLSPTTCFEPCKPVPSHMSCLYKILANTNESIDWTELSSCSCKPVFKGEQQDAELRQGSARSGAEIRVGSQMGKRDDVRKPIECAMKKQSRGNA